MLTCQYDMMSAHLASDSKAVIIPLWDFFAWIFILALFVLWDTQCDIISTR